MTTLRSAARLGLTTLILPALALACGGSAPEAQAPQAEASPAAGPTQADANASLPKASNAGVAIKAPMLDDMEDGDSQITNTEGRAGYWYTYKDATSQIAPEGDFKMTEGGADGSKFAARFSGTIGDGQYPFAGMGFSFFDPKAAYDLSSCKGISFKAKKGTAESTGMLRMKVGDVNTAPEGGVCKDCFNDFGRDVLLTEEWSEITTNFYEMKQEPYWGEPKPQIDASRAYQVQFQVKEGPFDIYVDDVKLVGCAE